MKFHTRHWLCWPYLSLVQQNIVLTDKISPHCFHSKRKKQCRHLKFQKKNIYSNSCEFYFTIWLSKHVEFVRKSHTSNQSKNVFSFTVTVKKGCMVAIFRSCVNLYEACAQNADRGECIFLSSIHQIACIRYQSQCNDHVFYWSWAKTWFRQETNGNRLSLNT